MPADDTFAALWVRRVSLTPDRIFLLFEAPDGTVTRWTYAEFNRAVEGCRALLHREGVRAGDVVHVALRNCPAFIALWLASAVHGACFVPVDPESSERELATQLARVAPRLGIYGSSRAAAYRSAAAGRGIPTLGFAEDAGDLERCAARADLPASRAGALDRLSVMFTSGTTSQPKGVVLTQANFREVAVSMASAAGLESHHRWFVSLPLFHANAQYYCFAPAIAVGASVALTWRFSASGWVASARRLEATHASLFAAPIRMILARTPEVPSLELQHVWFAQSLGAEHYERFSELVGVRPRQLYGMTETVAIVTADQAPTPRPDRIGRAAGGRRVRLVDPASGAAAPPGHLGMIQVAGIRGRDLFVEYLDDPLTTARAFDVDADQVTWLKTGDLAIELDDGSYQFVGRADDVIKVAGENVSLTEVEAAVAQAPGVAEAAVLSRPDPVRDAVPIAYVVPVDSAAPPVVADLESWARENLAPSARPREWHLIDALPRTSVGKVRRFMIENERTEQE